MKYQEDIADPPHPRTNNPEAMQRRPKPGSGQKCGGCCLSKEQIPKNSAVTRAVVAALTRRRRHPFEGMSNAEILLAMARNERPPLRAAGGTHLMLIFCAPTPTTRAQNPRNVT
eukprot:898329-Amphidinium_carterae.1